jgi:hypothetical protein
MRAPIRARPKGIPMPSPTPRLTALGPVEPGEGVVVADEGIVIADEGGAVADSELELLGVAGMVMEIVDMAKLMTVEAWSGRSIIEPIGTENASPPLQQLVGSGPQQYLTEPSDASVLEHGNKLDPKDPVPRKL